MEQKMEIKNKVDVVIGLGFGDEGKGNITNALCTEKSLVVRLNGGHQAAHHVHCGKLKHTFSSFGSGTLKGARTYISEFCTLDPLAFMTERALLVKKLGEIHYTYVNGNTMITTPFDVLTQQISDDSENHRHGTVGVGFGTTIERNEEHFHIYARDLFFPEVLTIKLRMINNYYYPRDIFDENSPLLIKWMKAAMEMADNIHIVRDLRDIANIQHIVFEGAQGVMLDQKYGFFPHVTRSNTTVENVYKILGVYPGKLVNSLFDITIYNVTRAYQTRHGNGPMTSTVDPKLLPNAIEEVNKTNKYQGEFRRMKLDQKLLAYALSCNRHEMVFRTEEKLVITCMDHLIKPFNVDRLVGPLKFIRRDIFVSYSPEYSFDK